MGDVTGDGASFVEVDDRRAMAGGTNIDDIGLEKVKAYSIVGHFDNAGSCRSYVTLNNMKSASIEILMPLRASVVDGGGCSVRQRQNKDELNILRPIQTVPMTGTGRGKKFVSGKCSTGKCI